MDLTKAEIERFKQKYVAGSKKSCWEWKAGKFMTGYGMACLRRGNRKTFLAHRLAWIIHNKRDVPEKHFICHSCDNRSCVNPYHLRAGTGAANNADTIKRGRGNRKLGSECSWSKITEKDVRYIRASGLKQVELAKKFGLKQSTVCNIMTRKIWKHVLP